MTSSDRTFDTPFAVHGKQENDYYRCALGQSMTRPFCYGSFKNVV